MFKSSVSAPVQILLVEDNQGDVELTTVALQQGKISNRLSVVEDGVEAMAFLHREAPYQDAPRPDLILLDLNLPRKGGRETLEEMSHDPALSHIPVLILTSSETDRNLLRAYDMDPNRYFVKPLDCDRLFAFVNSLNTPIVSGRSAHRMDQPAMEQPGREMIRVLLVEDNPGDSELTLHSLRHAKHIHFTLEATDAFATTLQRLEAGAFDILLLDLSVLEGRDLRESIENFKRVSNIPIVVVTELDDEPFGMEAVRAGAEDYLVKGRLEGDQLVRSIRFARERHHRQQLEEQHLVQQRLLTHRCITTLEEERRALAFELHDGLTQYIMASFAFFESYTATLKSPRKELPFNLQKGLKYLQEAVSEARRMINGLRLLALDELGLAGALEQLLLEEQEKAEWEEAPLLVEDTIPRLGTLLETTAYRVVQEALTNARKHAGSKRVTVRLQMPVPADGLSWRLLVEIRDWGKGFAVDEKREASEHVGLHSMQERANLLNGRILIESRPGEGTRIYAEFPIEATPQETLESKE